MFFIISRNRGSDILHNPPLLLRQPIQLIHRLINLFIRRIDLALEDRINKTPKAFGGDRARIYREI